MALPARVSAVLACLVAALVAATPALAATNQFSVLGTNDPLAPGGLTPCTAGSAGQFTCLTLRDAVHDANAAAGDVNNILLPPGTYVLQHGQLMLSHVNELAGNSGATRSTVISGNDASRVFIIQSSSATIRNVTLTHGNAGPGGAGGAVDANGGAFNFENVAITNSFAPAGGGGAVAAGPGALTFTNSVVSGNRTDMTGGGILLTSTVPLLSVSESTISGNTAGGDGGGLYITAGGGSVGPHNTNHATVAANGAAAAGNVNSAGSITLTDTVVGAPAAGGNCDGPVGDGGGNAESTDSCGLGVTSVPHADLRLGPLADNGGPTDTHALGNGSQALDEATACSGTFLDQRGVTEPQGSACDAGGYEALRDADLGISQSAAPVSGQVGSDFTFTLTVSSSTSSAQPNDAAQPVIQDSVPAGMALISSSSSQGSCSGTATVTCALGRLANGAGATVTLVMRGSAPGTVANTATVTSPRFDVTPLDDSATSSVAVQAASPAPDTTAPVLSALTFSPSKFRASKGSKVSYTLTEKAAVTFTVTTKRPGRRVGGRCVKPTRKTRKRKACTRTVAVPGSLRASGTAGPNSFHFNGRLGGRALKPGLYRLVVRATDAAGNRSKQVSATFRIVR